MKTTPTILVILLVALAFACRSKKTTTEKESVTRIDTIYQEVTRIDTLKFTETKEITKPVYFETEIPCDEEQSGTVGSGNNLFNYKIKNGKVNFDFKIDSTECLTRKEYRAQWKSDSLDLRKYFKRDYSSQKEVIRYVYPWWVWLLGAGCAIFAAMWVYQKFFIPLP